MINRGLRGLELQKISGKVSFGDVFCADGAFSKLFEFFSDNPPESSRKRVCGFLGKFFFQFSNFPNFFQTPLISRQGNGLGIKIVQMKFPATMYIFNSRIGARLERFEKKSFTSPSKSKG